MAALELRDGRVFHNARIVSNETDSVVIRADEGLIKVAKSVLPQPVADALGAKPPPPVAPEMVMQPFNPEAPQAPPQEEMRPKPAPKPAPGQKPAVGQAFKGCALVSFQMKPFHNWLGCAEVVIRNDTSAPVVIFPRDIACTTTAGARYAGQQFVAPDASPPLIKRREVVPPQGSANDLLTFSNDAIEISSVQWSK